MNLKRIKQNIQLYDGAQGVKYYVTVTDNGKQFNKMYDTLEEAEDVIRRIKRSQVVGGLKFPDNLIEFLFIDKDYLDIDIVEENFAENFYWVIESLTEREQDVLIKRYVEDLTLESVAKIYNVTRERVRQVEAKALRKLRHPARLSKLRFGKKVYEYQDDIKKLEEELAEIKKNLLFKINNPEALEIDRDEILMSMPIEKLDLSLRTYRSLKRECIGTVKDLYDFGIENLNRLRNIGKFSIDEITKQLIANGFKI